MITSIAMGHYHMLAWGATRCFRARKRHASSYARAHCIPHLDETVRVSVQYLAHVMIASFEASSSRSKAPRGGKYHGWGLREVRRRAGDEKRYKLPVRSSAGYVRVRFGRAAAAEV